MNNKQRRDNTRTIGDAIRELIEAYKLDDKLLQTKIIAAWPEVAGSYIAKNTEKIYISEHTLFVGVHSSIIKNELRLAQDDLIDQLNTIAGKEYITKIVFV